MKFHVDLARHRTILAGECGHFLDAMPMDATRIVTEPIAIEMNKDWNLSAENQMVPAIIPAATYQPITIKS